MQSASLKHFPRKCFQSLTGTESHLELSCAFPPDTHDYSRPLVSNDTSMHVLFETK